MACLTETGLGFHCAQRYRVSAPLSDPDPPIAASWHQDLCFQRASIPPRLRSCLPKPLARDAPFVEKDRGFSSPANPPHRLAIGKTSWIEPELPNDPPLP